MVILSKYCKINPNTAAIQYDQVKDFTSFKDCPDKYYR